jgi:FkbM family methyltransferase
MKEIARNLARRAGYRLERWHPANRFDGMRDSLEVLAACGLRPSVVIDGGANAGHWTRLAREVFPDASFHLIEPQPACRAALERFVRENHNLTLYPVALTSPGQRRISMTGGTGEGGTGARVPTPKEAGDPAEIECEAATLDELFGKTLKRSDRALLKLDLEGHEVAAISGGAAVLDAVEAVLIEAQLFDINDNGLPVFGEVYQLLASRGFELFDIASLGGRPRDGRLRMLDAVFVRSDSRLCRDRGWL